MRVLHIAAANSTTGGGEKHVSDCLKEMAERNIELGLVAPEGGDLAAIAAELGVVYCSVPINKGFSKSRIDEIRTAIRIFEPDIIHAHGHRAALFARLADSEARNRLVYTFHGIHVDKGRLASLKLALERALKSRTATFIATCKSDKKRALYLSIAEEDKIRVIYNGIYEPQKVKANLFRKTHTIGEHEKIILTVARISKPKNLEGLLRIFEMLVLLNQEFAGLPLRLVMICPGSDKDFKRLESKVKSHPYASQITLLPRQDNLSFAYKDADVFALASLWEARAYVVVEALSYGTPVVGYDIDGTAEAVEHGKSGLLVKMGDEQAFAEALLELLNSPEKAKTFGAYGAQDMSQRFSVDVMISELLALYQSVLDAKPT